MLIVADDIEGEAMNALVVNNVKNILKCCAIRAPEFGNGRSSAMSDLAILLGTAVYSNSTTDITKVQVSDLGTAKKITVGRNETIIQDPDSNQKELEVRLDEIRTLASTPGLDINEKNLCQRRLSRLAGGIAIIRVGGSTEAELRERRDRIDDALHATKAAVNGGYLPGGGTALIKCLSKLKAPPSDPGYELLRKACEEPIKQIARNCGQVPELVSAKVLETKAFSHGYNARTDEYCDLIEAGVLDPTLVVTSALRHATSAAINLLSISCSITIEDNHD